MSPISASQQVINSEFMKQKDIMKSQAPEFVPELETFYDHMNLGNKSSEKIEYPTRSHTYDVSSVIDDQQYVIPRHYSKKVLIDLLRKMKIPFDPKSRAGVLYRKFRRAQLEQQNITH